MSRYAYAIFCDDVRNEQGNKISLMGIYNGEMHLPSLPALLPKLGLSVRVSSPIEEPVTSVQFRLASTVADGPSFVIDLPAEEIQKARGDGVPGRQDSEGGETHRRMELGLVTVLPPFQVSTPMSLSVTVIVDGTEFKAASLRIRLQPGPQRGPASAPA